MVRIIKRLAPPVSLNPSPHPHHIRGYATMRLLKNRTVIVGGGLETKGIFQIFLINHVLIWRRGRWKLADIFSSLIIVVFNVITKEKRPNRETRELAQERNRHVMCI